MSSENERRVTDEVLEACIAACEIAALHTPSPMVNRRMREVREKLARIHDRRGAARAAGSRVDPDDTIERRAQVIEDLNALAQILARPSPALARVRRYVAHVQTTIDYLAHDLEQERAKVLRLEDRVDDEKIVADGRLDVVRNLEDRLRKAKGAAKEHAAGEKAALAVMIEFAAESPLGAALNVVHRFQGEDGLKYELARSAIDAVQARSKIEVEFDRQREREGGLQGGERESPQEVGE